MASEWDYRGRDGPTGIASGSEESYDEAVAREELRGPRFPPLQGQKRGNPMALVSQAEHARLCGVSKKSVTIWKAQGKLTMVGSLVDHEASYKGENWHASVKAARTEQVTPEVTRPVTQHLPAVAAKADAPEVLPAGRAKLNEAVTRKEEFAGRIRELEYLEKSGKLVEIDVARRVLFDEARAARDAWLNWVPSNAAMIAADLGVEADKVAEVLTGYVHRQLAQLGDPSGDFQKG